MLIIANETDLNVENMRQNEADVKVVIRWNGDCVFLLLAQIGWMYIIYIHQVTVIFTYVCTHMTQHLATHLCTMIFMRSEFEICNFGVKNFHWPVGLYEVVNFIEWLRRAFRYFVVVVVHKWAGRLDERNSLTDIVNHIKRKKI